MWWWMNDVMERGMENRLLLVQHMMDTDEDGQEKTLPQHVLHHEPSPVCLPPVSFQHNWEKTPIIKRVLLYSCYHFGLFHPMYDYIGLLMLMSYWPNTGKEQIFSFISLCKLEEHMFVVGSGQRCVYQPRPTEMKPKKFICIWRFNVLKMI